MTNKTTLEIATMASGIPIPLNNPLGPSNTKVFWMASMALEYFRSCFSNACGQLYSSTLLVSSNYMVGWNKKQQKIANLKVHFGSISFVFFLAMKWFLQLGSNNALILSNFFPLKFLTSQSSLIKTFLLNFQHYFYFFQDVMDF